MEQAKGRRRDKTALFRNIAEWAEALVFAFAVIVLLYTFCLRVITVSGRSMMETLSSGDRVVVQCAGYTPQRGDVVVVDSFSSYGAPLIKRIIALEGDVVDIDFTSGAVTVNGQKLDEPYVSSFVTPQYDVQFPLTVAPGHVFLLGDNREISLDSRSAEVGQIDVRNVLGRVLLRIFPIGEWGRVS